MKIKKKIPKVVSVVPLIIKEVRSLYTNAVLFREHFRDYHFLNSSLRTQIVVTKLNVKK